MSAIKNDSKIDYQALEEQRTDLLKAQLKLELKNRETGKGQSLRRAVLRLVVEGQYKDACDLVDEYLETKKIFPSVGDRARPHQIHSKELINAIRAKRNFPNLSQLSMSKQQEILDHAVGHFDELKYALKAIEHMVHDEAVKDTRSTVWVIKTICYVVLSIFVTAFLLDFYSTVGKPLWVVFDQAIKDAFQFMIGFP